MEHIIKQHLAEHLLVASQIKSLEAQIQSIAKTLIQALKDHKTIFWCGNGGSASDSQHLAGELIGRFVGDRKPLKSISLITGGAEGSCIANDFGYEQIFSRQVEGLGSMDDVLIGITTSGNSQNVLNAYKKANEMGMKTIGLLGKGGGKAASLVQQSVIVPSNTTARIQEMHILIGHILCDLIEEGLHLKA